MSSIPASSARSSDNPSKASRDSGARASRKTRRPSGRYTPERRQEIVEAAATLFLSHGYEEVSIDDVVARVGGSKGTIYSWFGGKAGLFEAVIREFCARTSNDLEIEFDPTLPVAEQLHGFSRAFLKLILSRQSLQFHRLIVSITGRFPDLARVFYEAGPESAYGMLQHWIERQQANRQIVPGNARQMAILHADMLTAHHQLAGLIGIESENTAARVDATIRQATSAFMAAYGATGGGKASQDRA